MSINDKSIPKISVLAESMGIKLINFQEGKCSVYTKILGIHLNAGGVAHGGLHATMLDTALGGALVSTINKDEWCATAQLDISYIEPGYEGEELFANGFVIRRGKSLAHCEGTISDSEGKLIATGKGTWIIWQIKPKNLL
ncbi:MAG: PaaI family thioesterase [Euryarchaeota archaeon]|nr:PaaI family thioesterase [Euryarchaeota archaeon]MBT4392375.1 PaaI family thioesterase [Euryarchaeota archaeon]MBT4802319.1 PaaI family thioesterase [Euryarchaeota archaeon]MBT5613311.1 PaaI family thioesterase [Euryarchaeota archaeon]MBT6684625.1 PaaI family thioesterase [Euryarchaeota archaeon]